MLIARPAEGRCWALVLLGAFGVDVKLLLLLFLTFFFLFPSRSAGQRTASPDKGDTSAVERTKYVGLRHSASLPYGLKDVGGALVSRLNDAKEYGISEVRRGRVRMLWFEYLTHRDQAGAPYWEVKDVLALPSIRRNQVLVYSLCFSGQKPDSEIVAIADYQPYVEFFTRVRRAWRANRSVERFEEISPRGVKCTNEGYGV
jgi:hypothetical protein